MRTGSDSRFRQALLASSALLAALATTTGCDITSFLGPGLVGLGDTATLKVSVQSLGDTTSAVDLHVLLRVPSGWTVDSASWSGEVNGSAASGTPTQSAVDPSVFCDFSTFVGTTPAGFQDVYFSESFAQILEADNGTLEAIFNVLGSTGTFNLVAATAVEDATTGLCADTVKRQIRIATAIPIGAPWVLVTLAVGLLAAALLLIPRRT